MGPRDRRRRRNVDLAGVRDDRCSAGNTRRSLDGQLRKRAASRDGDSMVASVERGRAAALLMSMSSAQIIPMILSGSREGRRISRVNGAPVVREIGQRLGKGQAVEFRFAEFEIDLEQQELRRSGQVIAIEPQVFDLLVYLVSNRHRIVSKDELIEAVWQGRIISDAALSSRVSAARRAIGDNGEDQRLIRTLHKRGFRFVGALEDDGAAALAEPAASASPPLAVVADEDQGGGSTDPAAERGRAGDAATALPLPDKPSIAVLPFQ